MWRDPLTWPPPGRGCRWCHEEVPYAHKICRSCWIRRMVGWDWSMIAGWLVGQKVSYDRIQERKAALALWRDEGIPTGITNYAEKYGVWLVPQEEINR